MASTLVIIQTLGFLFTSLADASANSKTYKGLQSTLYSSGAPINLACRATQLPDLCQSSLSSTKVTANAGAEEIIGAAMGLASDGAKQTHLLSQNLLATFNYDANVTAAAKDCMEFADSSIALIAKSSGAIGVEQRIKDVKAWMSAALAYVYDCSSDLRYVNTTQKISTVIQQVDWVTNLTSNALSMVDALDTYGKDMGLWRPPRTERSPNSFSSAHYYRLENKNWDLLEVDVVVPHVTVSKQLDHKSSISSIQQAVNSAPDYSDKRFVIKIEAGVYEETVRIPRSKTNLMFVGAGMDSTVITGSAYVPSLPGPVTIYDVATVGVKGDGFIAQDITFRNTFPGPRTHQAVALRVDSDFSAFYRCAFESHQDTLYTHTLRQFYKNCRIEGTHDFIFGNAAALFDNCTILVRPRQLKSKSGENDPITAQGRTDPAQSTGLVFQHCTIDGTKEYINDFISNPSVHKAYLGRPWKMYSRTVFMNCYLGKLITPEGWMPWNGSFALDTLFYGEYNNYGQGANVHGRVPWSDQISQLNVGLYSVQSFIQGDEWLPSTDST